MIPLRRTQLFGGRRGERLLLNTPVKEIPFLLNDMSMEQSAMKLAEREQAQKSLKKRRKTVTFL